MFRLDFSPPAPHLPTTAMLDSAHRKTILILTLAVALVSALLAIIVQE
ncbi:MAG: hypothetical protein RIS54_1864 [Verrucomicrobiota bacterium]